MQSTRFDAVIALSLVAFSFLSPDVVATVQAHSWNPTAMAADRAQGKPAVKSAPKPASAIETGSGSWNRYSYQFTKGKEGVVVTFTPFLPRNDEAVVGAMRHVAKRILNVDLSNAPPTPMGRAINFYARKTLSFMIVKEDTGEIHSFVIREL